MITFPIEDTFPLGSTPKIIEEHFGISEINHPVCDGCGTDFIHQYELDNHDCPMYKCVLCKTQLETNVFHCDNCFDKVVVT